MPTFVDMTIDSDQMLRTLNRLADNSQAVARASTAAGLSVLANACRQQSPGSVKEECGWFIRNDGERVWGRAGLMRFPKQGDGQNGPHGLFLTIGTRYIVARHFIENALRGAAPRARAAAKRAAERKIAKLARQ